MDARFERYKVYLTFLLFLVAAAGLLFWWLNRPKPPPIIIVTPVPTSTLTSIPTPTPSPLRVYVSGAVVNPDVYILAPGSIVKDALVAAGGATQDADLTRVNLALALVDQQQVYVPHKGETVLPVQPPIQPADASSPAGGLVNINTATVEQLDTLPGIGPALAERIIQYRTENGPFEHIEDLMKVKGIGPAMFEKLKDKITTR